MSLPNTLSVTIMDKEYVVACPPENRDELREAARLLDQRMREVRNTGKVHGTERIAVMTALNLAYDVLREQERQSALDASLRSLEAKIDSHLKTEPA